MKYKKGLISIITTSYNYEKYIGKTIESILSQTYTNWELIIADDASTDNSVEVIKRYKDNRIKLIISKKNCGAAKNYRKAYKLCRGEYLTGIDSDDYIHPNKFEKQIKILNQKKVDICGTYITQIDKNGDINNLNKHEKWFNKNIDLNKADNWIWRNHLCHSSVLMKKKIHDQIGLPDKYLIYTPDYDLWLRCLSNNYNFYIIPEKLTYYRVHDNNITQKNPNKYFWEYAYISAKTLHPYLFKINRYDLIKSNIEPFSYSQEHFKTSLKDHVKLIELFSIENFSKTNFNKIEKLLSNKNNISTPTKKIISYVKEKNIQLENIKNNSNEDLHKKNKKILTEIEHISLQTDEIGEFINKIKTSKFFKLWQSINLTRN